MTIKNLVSIANRVDQLGLHDEADQLDFIIKSLASKRGSRGNPIFSKDHPKVTDDKDHFPINSVAQARNALARANQYSEAPSWWSGTLQQLVNSVVREVRSKFPSIEISDASSRPGPK